MQFQRRKKREFDCNVELLISQPVTIASGTKYLTTSFLRSVDYDTHTLFIKMGTATDGYKISIRSLPPAEMSIKHGTNKGIDLNIEKDLITYPNSTDDVVGFGGNSILLNGCIFYNLSIIVNNTGSADVTVNHLWLLSQS